MRDISIFEQRRIEAEIIKPIFDVLRSEFGVETAQRIIRDAIKQKAVEFGEKLARREQNGTSLRKFAQLLPMWTKGNALEIDVLEDSVKTFSYNVTRCRYAEMYQELGLSDIGHLLSCNRDGSFCDGYDPRLKLTRTQTIMQGSSHCDFRYQWTE